MVPKAGLPAAMASADLWRVAERLAGTRVNDAVSAGGSGNSRVYRLETAAGFYALKCYPADEKRDRLGVEVAALSFLAAQAGWDGLVPRAVAADPEARAGLFTWLDGVRPLPATGPDLRALAGYPARFLAVSAAPGAERIGPAAEAATCAADVTGQIEARLRHLASVRASEPALDEFLNGAFMPLWRRAVENLRGVYRAAGLEPARPLEGAQLVLSPSDFGLHNALRLVDGPLALLDFEYFGWDDPVRLVVDPLCHPAMELKAAERAAFFAAAAPAFRRDPGFTVRVRALAPLIALRWAQIVLNEFLPSHWQRRLSAGAAPDWASAKARQLEKAVKMLELCEEFLGMDWS